MQQEPRHEKQQERAEDWNSAAFARRLREVIGKDSVHKFSKKCGLGESMLRKYLSGDSVPGADKLIRIAGTAAVELQWLATGEGPKSEQDSRARLSPSKLAVVREFKRYAERRPETGTHEAMQVFVNEYNRGVLEFRRIGDVEHISEEELILWRDLAWERRAAMAAIDEEILCTSIEIADELLEASGKATEPAKKAKLSAAIYRLNATTEGGIDRSTLVHLLMSFPSCL